jgi:hypothetical protein
MSRTTHFSWTPLDRRRSRWRRPRIRGTADKLAEQSDRLLPGWVRCELTVTNARRSEWLAARRELTANIKFG